MLKVLVRSDTIDPAFAQCVRSLLEALANGREPAIEPGGLWHLLNGAGSTARLAVAKLSERWFGPLRVPTESESRLPILNDERTSDDERLAAILVGHVAQRRPWTTFSTNESTFYRYRRAAFAEFSDRAWREITGRVIPTNRPRPDFERFVGRVAERAEIIRRLVDGGPSVVGIEGPGGTGKTALAQAVVSTCLEGARQWNRVDVAAGVSIPLFYAIAWVANRQSGLNLSDFLDVLARTLDYPGLLGRELADRRSALRDLLSRQPVLIVVDDVDRADPAILGFLSDLPPPSRALVTTRRRLPPRVSSIAPGPLDVDEALEILRSEGARQAFPSLVAAPDAALRPLADSTRRFPLLTVWAAGQLRQGQTVERVQARLGRAEGGIFEEMFAGSAQALSDDGRRVLQVLPIFVAPAYRPAVVAAAGDASDPEVGIDELLEASLLEATEGLTDSERRYALHPIARAFVRRRLPLDVARERVAIYRAASHYGRMCATFAGSVQQWASFDRIEPEIQNILALSAELSREAVATGDPPGTVFNETLVALAHDLRNFFWLRHYWREGLEFFHRAIDASRRLEDSHALGWNTYSLAYLHFELGTGGYREARVQAARAVELLRQSGDLRGVGHAMRLLGRTARESGDFERAWSLLEDAEALLRLNGRGDDVSIVRASQADLLRRQDRLDEAAMLYLDVLSAGIGDPGTRANVLQNLGDVRLKQNRLDVAETLFAEGERIANDAGARGLVAECRWGLARVARGRRDAFRSAVLAGEAADLFERLGEAERATEARAMADV
jgi:tetratricopeptide (TPR) repeat protein